MDRHIEGEKKKEGGETIKMKINYKKSLKFVTLLIASLLIATASAAVYRYMDIQGTITVGNLKLIWIAGSDVPDATIVGSIATVSLNVENNTAINFTESLLLKNNASSGSFNYKITVKQALLSSDFEIAKLHLYENKTNSPNWTHLAMVDLTDSNSQYESTTPLSAGDYIRITIEVKAIQDGISKQFKVQVEYWPSS